jgi:hemoglobin
VSGGEDPGRGALYERVGGREFFARLVADFYRRVASDERLRAMYPEDLGPPQRRLAAFLVQYFGGPRDYEALRGEPRLRLRHLGFPIDKAARDAWFAHMSAAVSAADLPPAEASELRSYFEQTSTFLINRGGLSLSGENPRG